MLTQSQKRPHFCGRFFTFQCYNHQMSQNLSELQKAALVNALHGRISKQLSQNRKNQVDIVKDLKKKSETLRIEKLRSELQ